MNQKGIILSGLVYALLIFFLLLVASLLTVMWYRQNALNNLKDDADDIYDDYVPEILLTSRFSINAGTSGLYTLKNGSSYFSGVDPNNWLAFGKIGGNTIMWRVIKNDPEGIKIVYEGVKNGTTAPVADGRVQVDSSNYAEWDATNSNKWERPSDLSSKLSLWYNTLTDVSNYVQPINWCVGAIGNNPTIDEFVSGECIAQTSSGGTFVGRTSNASAVGMIRPSDYIYSSSAATCNAYNQTDCGTNNYLAKTSYNYWTLNAYSMDSANIWTVLSTGAVNYNNANNAFISIRPVLNLSSDVNWYSGNGTLTNPYTIK